MPGDARDRPPRDIQAVTAEDVLRVDWDDGDSNGGQRLYPFRFLRQQCQCARCVNEWTGERMLDPEAVPEDVSILGMELVGSYALRIRWSDGHDSGLLTWARLRELTPPT